MIEQKPEILYFDPNDFYTKKESKRYDDNSGMKKTQKQLTSISLSLFLEETNNFSKNINILDVGCGTGFSLDFFKENGYKNIIGIEPAIEMLNLCKKKNPKCYLGGFEDFQEKINPNQKFDFIISISALQWVVANKQDLEIKNIIKKIGKNLKQVLAKDGRIIIQYYPLHKNTNELIASSLTRVGFKVKEYIYNKDNPKKEKQFFILSVS